MKPDELSPAHYTVWNGLVFVHIGSRQDIAERVASDDRYAEAVIVPLYTREQVLAAEKRGEERERERCAQYHDDRAAEHEAFREMAPVSDEAFEHHRKMARVHCTAAREIRKGTT